MATRTTNSSSSSSSLSPSSPSASTCRLLVIGAGLPRTGTTSQRLALQQLLNGRCYHMRDIVASPRATLPLWKRALNNGMSRSLAEEIFNGYSATVDYPGSPFYKELMQLFPDAKVILSTRDADSWVRSMRATVLAGASESKRLPWLLRRLLNVGDLNWMLDTMYVRDLGADPNQLDDKELAEAFERYNQSVRSAVPKERLLEFRVTDGWEPLCHFLNLPVPDSPFPRANDAEAFRREIRVRKMFAFIVNAVIWLGGVAAAAAGSTWLYRRIA